MTTRKPGSRHGAGGGAAPADRRDRVRKLLTHPVRMRIAGWLSGRSNAQTQREIGKALRLSTASVHYHLKPLADVGLVRLVGTRPGPNGITEKLYQADPRTWKDAALDERAKAEFYLDYTLAAMQEMRREAAGMIKSDWRANPFLAGAYETWATEAEVRRFKRRIQGLIDEFQTAHNSPRDGARPLAITLGLLPSGAAGWRGQRREFDMMAD